MNTLSGIQSQNRALYSKQSSRQCLGARTVVALTDRE
jgi:hypothetical protein